MGFRLRPGRNPRLSEKDVIQASLALLGLRHYFVRRLNTGKFELADGRWRPEGTPGDPDYVALHETLPGFLIEFKRPGGKLSQVQENRHFELRACFQIEIAVIDSVDAMRECLDRREKR